MKKLTIKTGDKCQLLDITSRINETIASHGFKEGALLLMVPHTTAGITINETHDTSVKKDIIDQLNKIVPFSGNYSHREGNSPAHIKSSFVGCDQMVPIEKGQMVLGTWQGVFFCEFDGPRNRNLYIKYLNSDCNSQ